MKLSKLKHVELARLLSRVVENAASDQDLERVQELLEGDASARAFYLRYMQVHADIERTGGQVFASDVPVRQWRRVPWLAVAVVMVLLGSGGHYLRGLLGNPDADGVSADLIGICAIVSGEQQAVWDLSGERPSGGQALKTGRVTLKTGQVQLEMLGGAQVVIQAPALFELTGESSLTLHRGKLGVRIVAEGAGMVVHMPYGMVIDLGTAFTVEVAEDGEGVVNVFEGDVIVASTDSQGRVLEEAGLVAGEAAAVGREFQVARKVFDGGGLGVPLMVVPQKLDLHADYVRTVRETGPVGYWRFDELEEGGLVPDEVGSSNFRLLSGGELVEGGFNQCLALDGETGFAVSDQSFPGLEDERGWSMSVWFRSERMAWNTLGGLVEYGAGSHRGHEEWDPQIFVVEQTARNGDWSGRSGRLVPGKVFQGDYPDFSMRGVFRVRSGHLGGVNVLTQSSPMVHQWVHLVAVRELRSIRLYINGELACQEEVERPVNASKEFHLALGRVRCYDRVDVRYWKGFVDDVSLHDRVLTPDEISRIYQSALPEESARVPSDPIQP